MTKYIIQKYKCIKAFIKAKIDTDLLLDELRRNYGLLIQPKAVELTLSSFQAAKALSKNDVDKMLELFSNANKYSVVAYPVSYHVDTFFDKKPSLENKMCFYHARISNRCGRGGYGPNKYCWALLDWSNKDKGYNKRNRQTINQIN